MSSIGTSELKVDAYIVAVIFPHRFHTPKSDLPNSAR
jgi:hypothetical protein